MTEARGVETAVERGVCGLADVLIAWRALGADSDTERSAVARLLGFELTVPHADVEGDAKPEPPPPSSVPRPPSYSKPFSPEPPAPVHGAAGATLALMPMTPRPSTAWPALPAPLEGGSAVRVRSRDQLVPARWARAWHALLGRGASERGELDVPRVAGRIARGEPIVRLPRRVRPAAKRRLCVYIETGGHMAWLHDPALSLVGELRRVYDERVEVVWVEGRPPGLDTDGGGVRCLLVGTFGARVGWTPRDEALGREWVAFADSVRRAGGDAVALCPTDASAARTLFGERAPVVVWNDLASPSQAANALRRVRSP